MNRWHIMHSQSLSDSQLGHVKKACPAVQSSWAHFLHSWHCTHTYRDLLSLNGSPQIMQGHSSSSLLELTRLFFAVCLFTPVARDFFLSLGVRSFFACCIANLFLCGVDVRTVAHSAIRDLARGRDIFGNGDSCFISSLKGK